MPFPAPRQWSALEKRDGQLGGETERYEDKRTDLILHVQKHQTRTHFCTCTHEFPQTPNKKVAGVFSNLRFSNGVGLHMCA